MSVASLPDLNVLPGEALRALILAQHEQLLSAEDRLTATQEQLQSREREIEHLQLLLAKLHRMRNRWCGSERYTGSKKRFAVSRRTNAVPCASRNRNRCSTLCDSGSRRPCRNCRANRRPRWRFATPSPAGKRWCAI